MELETSNFFPLKEGKLLTGFKGETNQPSEL